MSLRSRIRDLLHPRPQTHQMTAPQEYGHHVCTLPVVAVPNTTERCPECSCPWRFEEYQTGETPIERVVAVARDAPWRGVQRVQVGSKPKTALRWVYDWRTHNLDQERRRRAT